MVLIYIMIKVKSIIVLTQSLLFLDLHNIDLSGNLVSDRLKGPTNWVYAIASIESPARRKIEAWFLAEKIGNTGLLQMYVCF